MAKFKQKAFMVGGATVPVGTGALIDLPVASLSNHTPITLPVHVIHGRRSGPVMFISAAIHGDEILGVEIIRRLLATKALAGLRGTLLCVPIVNAFGFISQSRYLPDRRDLNRSFPGSATGSLAGQLAHLFMKEIVARSDIGIDLHTGAVNRSNLPQLRGDFTRDKLYELACAFGAPIALNSKIREGSLRHAAAKRKIPVLLYEAGEALRLDEISIRVGFKGILNLMRHQGMLAGRSTAAGQTYQPMLASASRWVRSPTAGLLRAYKSLGSVVEKGETIGQVANPYDATTADVTAPFGGVIIGRTNISVVNQADALFHIAELAAPGEALEDRIASITSELHGDPIFDEDEVV
jgi:uncharacterized protein